MPSIKKPNSLDLIFSFNCEYHIQDWQFLSVTPPILLATFSYKIPLPLLGKLATPKNSKLYPNPL